MPTDLRQLDDNGLKAFEERLGPLLAPARVFEEAAQTLAREIYEGFRRDTVLARVYATIPWAELPARNQTFVRELLRKRELVEAPDTPVLSLLGTWGAEKAWRDRHLSENHVGIPLLDAAFVDSVPMIARLLKELGVQLGDLTSSDLVTRKLAGGFNGLFYVPDASLSLDQKGRHVIPAQDFVAQHGVKTVFGMGGQFLTGSLTVCVVFTRSYLPRLQAERFARIIGLFKARTAEMARARAFFWPEPTRR